MAKAGASFCARARARAPAPAPAHLQPGEAARRPRRPLPLVGPARLPRLPADLRRRRSQAMVRQRRGICLRDRRRRGAHDLPQRRRRPDAEAGRGLERIRIAVRGMPSPVSLASQLRSLRCAGELDYDPSQLTKRRREDAMADPISQDQRQGKLTTPLGENALALMQFSAIEGLSELFEIRIEAASTQGGLDFASALGKGSTITLQTQDDKKRYFHGVTTEARWAGTAGGSLSLPARAEAVALAAHADLGLQDLRAEVADRHHQAGVLRPRLLRFPRRDHRLAADARILRPVPRDGFQFRLPADGGIRRLLFLRACRRQAHAGARRREVEPSSRSPVFRPCPTTRSTTPDGENSNISRPGRSAAGRRAASSFSRTTATRNRPPTCSRSRRTPAATHTIRWRCSTTPTVTSTRRARISSTRASARSWRNTGSKPSSRSTSAAPRWAARRRCFPAD